MIFINECALKRIEAEVEMAKGIETGGILVGAILQNGDLLITHATSPGPKAIKKRNFFRKDYNYTSQVLDMLYRKYSVDYLGEWHKHPDNCIHYSPTDRKSMLSITMINTRPCYFAIVGDDFSGENFFNFFNLYSVSQNNQKIVKDTWRITTKPEELALNKGITV